MKRFIFAVVLLSIVCTLLSNEVTGSSLKNKRLKPGCPKPGIGNCVEECSGDGDCKPGERCCYNGCGHTCFKLVT
ncbi:WAP four-disulfide core domain protein 18-like [Oculina patagonica]